MTNHLELGFEHEMPGVTGTEVKILTPEQEQLDRIKKRWGTAENVHAIVEGLPGNPDDNTANLIEDANNHFLDDPSSSDAREDAVVADEIGAMRILEGGDIDNTAKELADGADEPLAEALTDIVAAHGEKAVETVVEAIEGAEKNKQNNIAHENSERMRLRDPSKLWLNDMFGTSELGEYRTDIDKAFEVPHEARKGEAVVDEYDQRERRPIMDISLDADSHRLVAETITKRSKGLDSSIQRMEQIVAEGRNWTEDDYDQLVADGVISRQFGHVASYNSERGTVADLYLDGEDLAKYDKIDHLYEQITGYPYGCREQIENRLISLAATTFPSGTELMHVTPDKAIGPIARKGGIAPRTEMLHGAMGERQINGGFVHMTEPGTIAAEYSGAYGVAIGISIDTIAKYSPHMQLENGYTGNEHRNGSTQETLGKFTINDLDEAPSIFRDRLKQMQANLARGLRTTDIGQGAYNNVSFAASADKDTAGRYTYPLGDLSLYVGSNDRDRAVQEYGRFGFGSINCSETAPQTGWSDAVGDIPQKTFDIKKPIVVYAPVSQRDVNFSESELHAVAHEYSLNTVDPKAYNYHVRELLENGVSPHELLDKAKQKGAKIDVSKHWKEFADAGMPIKDIAQQIAVDNPEGIGFFANGPVAPREYQLFTELAPTMKNNLMAAVKDYYRRGEGNGVTLADNIMLNLRSLVDRGIIEVDPDLDAAEKWIKQVKDQQQQANGEWS